MTITESLPGIAAIVSALIAVILLSLATHQLFLHPLRKVPGPRIAALTSLHEFYYDCVKGGGGQHAFKMREMHERYGTLLLPLRVRR